MLKSLLYCWGEILPYCPTQGLPCNRSVLSTFYLFPKVASRPPGVAIARFLSRFCLLGSQKEIIFLVAMNSFTPIYLRTWGHWGFIFWLYRAVASPTRHAFQIYIYSPTGIFLSSKIHPPLLSVITLLHW